ncbi:MAG: hypothetical protein DRI57_29365 [Deltaproteobacteria bacterium]|nr:MAG: hypothetical protein DRI57_29365 [Deltaproteobacteria bacterium]
MRPHYARYKEIPVQNCEPGCPHPDGEVLRIILFKKDQLLRSHAVKHFTNTGEEKSWKGVMPFGSHLIIQLISDLENIECPFMERDWHDDPPCSNCRRFTRCSEIMNEAEKAYLDIVEKILEEGASMPRYACFFSDEIREYVFCTVPDRKIVAKAALDGDIYNLMTCHSPLGFKSVKEICEKQMEKILSEARSKNIVWCNLMNWKARTEHADSAKKKRKKGKQSKKRSSKKKAHGKHHSKGGGSSFRKYL